MTKIISNLHSINIYIMLAIFLVIILTSAASADELSLKGDSFDFDPNTGIATMRGNAGGQYNKYFFLADEITVQFEEGSRQISTPEEILMSPGGFTGCDHEEHPHYIFQATTMEIYPGDYLIAYNVVFYELDGRLPLFYWPVLIINLDDEETNLEFEYGYSSTRGWYGKLTYNYRLPGFSNIPGLEGYENLLGDELPGQLYLDYYQNTGWAYGIQQHYIHTDVNKGYLYYFAQDNQDEIDGLFEWEASWRHDVEWYDWDATAGLDYYVYEDRNFLTGDINILNDTDDYEAEATGDYERRDYFDSTDRDRQVSAFEAKYDRRFAGDLRLQFDYDLESIDYLEREDRDRRQSSLQAGISKRFQNGLSTGINLARATDLRTEQRLTEENYAGIEADYRFGDGWRTDFELEYGRLTISTPEDQELQDRWSGLFRVERRIGDFRYNAILERDAPRYRAIDRDDDDDEEGVSFYRWPEFNLHYSPAGNLDYHLQVGDYYEDRSDIAAQRGAAKIEYSDRTRLTDWMSLRNDRKFNAFYYRSEKELETPAYFVYNNELRLTAIYGRNITFTNDYTFQITEGETPFNFDRFREEDLYETELRYRQDKSDLVLDTGYDLLEEEYLPLGFSLELFPTDDWDLRFRTEYDLNEMEFSDELSIRSRIRGNEITATSTLDFDLNEIQPLTFKNELEYEVSGEYGWYLTNEIEYDFREDVDERLKEFSMALDKRFHCRELRFRYDHADREFTVSYHLDIFGGRGPTVGRSEEESLIFDIGLQEEFQDNN